MRTLTLHLRDGFSSDTVVIRVGGEERWRSRDVTTKLLLGLAEEVPIQVPPGGVRIEVELPERDLRHELELAPGGDDEQMEVRLQDDELSLRRLEGPQGYL